MKKRKLILIVCTIILFIIGITVIFLITDKEPQNVEESIIEVSLVNKKVEAYTGSFCYKYVCVEKISPLEVNYDEQLIAIADETVSFEHLENKIKSITFYDFTTKEKLDVKIDIQDKSFTVPDLDGTYIVTVISALNSKEITYSFKLKINKISGEYKEMISNLKKDLYTAGYLDDNVEEFRVMKIYEWGYYPDEANIRYIEGSFYITCKENKNCTYSLTRRDWSDENNEKFNIKHKINYTVNFMIYDNNKFKEIKSAGFNVSTFVFTKKHILNLTE